MLVNAGQTGQRWIPAKNVPEKNRILCFLAIQAMSNDNGKNPMPNDKDNDDLVFTAFKNMDLYGKDHNVLSGLLGMTTCSERSCEFQKFLQRLDTYPTAERESHLFEIGSLLTTNNCAFLDLATNQSGSHALRTLFRRSPALDHLIFLSVSMNFFSLMTNLARVETGCLALNEVFQEIRGKYRDLIFKRVAKNADWLSFDHYGTHVVQNFLTLENPGATAAIAERLCGCFFRLAKERQGSYVVEKCLKSCFAREIVLEEFRGNDQEWVRMANDKFGNFVAQCALKVMKEEGMTPLLREFIEKLRPYFCTMKIGYGKNIVRLIQEDIERCL
ncbi:hypothetical protein CARUB_v10016455mg [Capsella rubella]|uniref:PUM-HD domain-containing protein n=1 Tax=Capsella rubella TaxID=81985 RepID=R0GBL0_9BRAS|nr:hypothetical protein CARUB_v10016455mg [Capsella rubella]